MCVWADSSAALAIVKRSGAGKLRHINISLLWVQDQEKLKKLVYEKVPGQANPADLFTKGVGGEKLQQIAWASGQTFLDGRAQTGLQAQGGSKVSKLAHAAFMQSEMHTDERMLWRIGQGGVVDEAPQLETNVAESKQCSVFVMLCVQCRVSEDLCTCLHVHVLVSA